MLRNSLRSNGLYIYHPLKRVCRTFAKKASSEPSEMSDIQKEVDPRILPVEKTDSKAWNEVINRLNPPDVEGIYRLRKFLVNPKLRKELIKKAKRQQMPHLVLIDLIKNSGKLSKDEYVESHIDRALRTGKWEDLPEDIETIVTRLQDLRMNEELIILGAGISGLSLAWFVSNSRPDLKIKILEKGARVGGYLESDIVNNSVFEYGPRTLLPSHPGTIVATHIMSDLGLIENGQLVGVPKSSPTNTKGIVFNNELLQLPRSSGDALKFLFSPIMKGIKFGAIKDLLFARPRKNEINDETIESFISRRFNKKLSDRFLSALMRGIYAGDVSELSARSVTRINKLYNLERLQGASIIGSSITGLSSSLDKYPNSAVQLLSQAMTDKVYYGTDKLSSRFSVIALKDGLQGFTDALEKKLSDNKNIEIIKDFKVTELVPVNEGCAVIDSQGKKIHGSIVVSTLAAGKVAPLLTGSRKAADLCREVKYANLAVVNFHFPTKQVGKDWFGFLIPKSEDDKNPSQVIGVVFDSSVKNATKPIKVGLEELALEERQAQQDRLIGMEESEKEEESKKQEFSFGKLKSFVEDQFSDEPANGDLVTQSTNPSGTTLTVMVGGDLWAGLSPEQIPDESTVISNSLEALKKYLKIDDIKPEDYIAHVTYQTNSIPQYRVGHGDLVQEIHDSVARAYDSRLYLSGTSFGKGVGVGDCIIDSLTIASRFSPQRKLLYPQFYINHYLTLTHPSLYA